MKVLYVISSLVYGGAERQVIAACNVLAKKGHDITLYVLDDKVPRLPEVDQENVKVVISKKSSEGSLKTIYSLYRYVKRHRPDIIHSYLFDADIFTRLVTFFCRSSVLIGSERNDCYSLKAHQKVAHFLTRSRVRRVIANSFAGQKVADRMYRPPTATEVVWNGIDLAEVDERVQACKSNYSLELCGDENAKYAVMVASIKPQKNHFFALEVAGELLKQNSSWHIVFVGDKLEISSSEYKTKVQSKYDSLDCKSRVHFIGRRSDVLEILSQAELSFMTSDYEGFPNSVLESMAVGVPVVSTSYSDIEKILPNNFQISHSRTAEAYMNCIESTLASRQSVVQQQRNWVEEHTTVQRLGEQLEKIYSKELEQKCS